MQFVELSIADLRDRSRELAKLVSRDGFRPEAVAYLARGAYLIGVEMGAYFECPLIELSAHRSGEATKGEFAPILARLPKFARHFLRSFEIRRRLTSDAGDAQRKTMRLTNRFRPPAECGRILLVDDSVDTGSSVRAALGLLRRMYPGAEIGVAVLNTFEREPLGGHGDWHLYEGVLLSTPSSKDNAQYGEFLRMYEAGLDFASLARDADRK